jgi:three-Cys-motif partner protein
MAKAKEGYWREYTNLQHVKHELIRNYINGWLPKLTQGKYGHGRVIYFDTHAGRGKHLTGNLGSPLVALQTVLEHSFFDRFQSEICFVFIEHDENNLRQLKKELAAFKPLPSNVTVECVGEDCFEFLNGLIEELAEERISLAPSFFFCDPFGFSIPGETLAKLMKFRGVEIFVNIIWRELDMAISQGRKGVPGFVTLLDRIFAGHDWSQIDSDDCDERAEQCVQLMRQVVGAEWATYIKMLGSNNRTRYFLLHLTNHDAGREYMKECVWKSCPTGGYYARQTDDPKQQFLIEQEPDLDFVEMWVVRKLAKRPRRWSWLIEKTRTELWLAKHTNQVVRKLRNEGAITATGYNGRFTPASDPLLTLSR